MLLTALYMYLSGSEKLDFTTIPGLNYGWIFLCAVWIILAIGMLLRLIPNQRIAVGARKHYACSYHAALSSGSGISDEQEMRKRLHKGALASAIAWIVLNAVVLVIFSLTGMLTPAVVVIIMLFFAVCDIVCILFYCPFQALFMRNRCCAVCRIHNWDYIMMCTPLIAIPSVFSYSLLLLSIAVIVYWEIALHKNPRYFMEETNVNLSCEQCGDKLCRLHSGEYRHN